MRPQITPANNAPLSPNPALSRPARCSVCLRAKIERTWSGHSAETARTGSGRIAGIKHAIRLRRKRRRDAARAAAAAAAAAAAVRGPIPQPKPSDWCA